MLYDVFSYLHRCVSFKDEGRNDHTASSFFMWSNTIWNGTPSSSDGYRKDLYAASRMIAESAPQITVSELTEPSVANRPLSRWELAFVPIWIVRIWILKLRLKSRHHMTQRLACVLLSFMSLTLTTTHSQPPRYTRAAHTTCNEEERYGIPTCLLPSRVPKSCEAMPSATMQIQKNVKFFLSMP